MLKAVESLLRAFSEFFNWRSILSENKPIQEVIDDKKDLEKACLFAESAISIVEADAVFNKAKQQKRFKHFVRKFRRYR